MKIYSLQEENEKLNASRGIVHPGINHDMFDVKKTTAPAPQRRMTPASQQRKTLTAPHQQKMPSSSQQQTPRQQPPQTPKRRLGLLVGWLIFMLFLFLVSYISDMF